jgi:hypothetical protein
MPIAKYTTLPDPVARLLGLPIRRLLELPYDRRSELPPRQLGPTSQEAPEQGKAA